jgi:hypothetical protein
MLNTERLDGLTNVNVDLTPCTLSGEIQCIGTGRRGFTDSRRERNPTRKDETGMPSFAGVLTRRFAVNKDRCRGILVYTINQAFLQQIRVEISTGRIFAINHWSSIYYLQAGDIPGASFRARFMGPTVKIEWCRSGKVPVEHIPNLNIRQTQMHGNNLQSR